MWPLSVLRARRELRRQCIDEIILAAEERGIRIKENFMSMDKGAHIVRSTPDFYPPFRTIADNHVRIELEKAEKKGMPYHLDFFVKRLVSGFDCSPQSRRDVPEGFIMHPVGIAVNPDYDRELHEYKTLCETLVTKALKARKQFANESEKTGAPFYFVHFSPLYSAGFSVNPTKSSPTQVLTHPRDWYRYTPDYSRIWNEHLAEELGVTFGGKDVGYVPGCRDAGSGDPRTTHFEAPIPPGERVGSICISLPADAVRQTYGHEVYCDGNFKLSEELDMNWLKMQTWYGKVMSAWEREMSDWEQTPLSKWGKIVNDCFCDGSGHKEILRDVVGGYGGWQSWLQPQTVVCDDCSGSGTLGAEKLKELYKPVEPKFYLYPFLVKEGQLIFEDKRNLVRPSETGPLYVKITPLPERRVAV